MKNQKCSALVCGDPHDPLYCHEIATKHGLCKKHLTDSREYHKWMIYEYERLIRNHKQTIADLRKELKELQ